MIATKSILSIGYTIGITMISIQIELIEMSFSLLEINDVIYEKNNNFPWPRNDLPFRFNFSALQMLSSIRECRKKIKLGNRVRKMERRMGECTRESVPFRENNVRISR